MFGRQSKTALGVGLISILSMTLILLGAAAETRMADAAMGRDIEAVRSLIREAADVNSAQGDGMTALHWAALHGDDEMTRLLLYAGANVRATTRLGGYTPLFLAAEAGFARVVDVLLEAGASAAAPARNGITPLMMAASSGNTEALSLLVEAGADVNAAETERGQTALAFAAAFNNPAAITVLLEHGADVDSKSNTRPPAQRPRRPGQQQQQQQQQRGRRGQQQQQQQQPPNRTTGANPRGELTPLMYAARQGHIEAVQALVAGGANLNEISADHSTALLIATINGNFDAAKVLAEAGADVNIASLDGATPLFGVVTTQWAADIDKPQTTTKYAEIHYLDLVKLILDSGADPNVRTTKGPWYSANREGTSAAGVTPFWRCAAIGDIDCMRLMVAFGADPQITNSDGITPLLIVAGAGFHGNDEVTTPAGRMATVKYLVENLNVDVNERDTAPGSPRNNTMNTSRFSGGFSALHNAAARGDNEMILYLVSSGARVDAVSRNGTTVVDMANGPRQRIQPYPDTVALLEMLGAVNTHKCISC